MQSLCKATKISITSKHADEPEGLRVTFSAQGEIETIEPMPEFSVGTLVEVKDVFWNNIKYKQGYVKNSETQFQNCMTVLTSYSLIMYQQALSVKDRPTTAQE